MEKLAPIIMCLVFAAIAYGLMRLTLKISSAAARRKILSYQRPSEESATAFLCSYFGEANVISGKRLLCPDTAGRRTYSDAGNIVILGSRIAVVEVKSLVGNINSDDDYTWHQSVRLRSGETKELDFPSPIFESKRHIEAVKSVLEKEKIPCPEIFGIVIFTSDKVRFSEKHGEVFGLSDGAAFLRSKSGKKTITGKQRREIIRAINKNSAKPAAFRSNSKSPRPR